VKWMIRVDMEGVTGVVDMKQVVPGADEYAFGQAMMMHDLLAVIEGLLQSEQDEVWLYDIHFAGRNVDLRRLDRRVRAICGKPHYAPDNEAYLGEGFDGMILLGLHAKYGQTDALLHHNYEHDIRQIVVRGREGSLDVGEIGLEALMAGEAEVPLVMVTGDSAGCAEALELLPDTIAVSVKQSLGETAAVCYPPAVTARLLKESAGRCAEVAPKLAPFKLTGPIELELAFTAGALLSKLQERLRTDARWIGADRLVLFGDTVIEAWHQYLRAKS